MSDKVVVTIPEKVLCKAIQIKDCRAEAFCGWWSKVYRESSSRKRNIENEEQYHEYQIWHVGVQEELDELKQEKRNIKKQIQLADGIVKEDLYTAYYAVSEKEEIVADREIEIPGMEDVAIEPETNVVVMNPDKLSDAKKTKDVAVAPINESMAKLQARISEIDTELTKDR